MAAAAAVDVVAEAEDGALLAAAVVRRRSVAQAAAHDLRLALPSAPHPLADEHPHSADRPAEQVAEGIDPAEAVDSIAPAVAVVPAADHRNFPRTGPEVAGGQVADSEIDPAVPAIALRPVILETSWVCQPRAAVVSGEVDHRNFPRTVQVVAGADCSDPAEVIAPAPVAESAIAVVSVIAAVWGIVVESVIAAVSETAAADHRNCPRIDQVAELAIEEASAIAAVVAKTVPRAEIETAGTTTAAIVRPTSATGRTTMSISIASLPAPAGGGAVVMVMGAALRTAGPRQTHGTAGAGSGAGTAGPPVAGGGSVRRRSPWEVGVSALRRAATMTTLSITITATPSTSKAAMYTRMAR